MDKLHSESRELAGLDEDLERLEISMTEAELSHQELIRQCAPGQQDACKNLLHYLALRREDLQDLQDRLHIAGLSSFASSESHIYAQLSAILKRLGKYPLRSNQACSYDEARADIEKKAASLFGNRDESGIPSIMVTFDSSYADDYASVKELLLSGMNIARINCAHDAQDQWSSMIKHVRNASAETGLPCKIYMDLAGPKIRTTFYSGKKTKRKIELKEGEKLILTETPFEKNKEGGIELVGTTTQGIISQLKEGSKILFDDGLIESVVEDIGSGKATLKVLRISSKTPFLKEGKGINFPDSHLEIPSLTEFDISCIPFICEHADLVGYSFVRTANDVAKLQEFLSLQGHRPFIVLKIEMLEAVQHLPSLLIQGMKESVYGVMIARGDLAIEIGFERMSEVQEEIAWICEAAHVPLIWATQVLETLNKSGVATRSEITDANYSSLAECVMINKGKHIVRVLATLRDILKRSGGHHAKKRYIFRALNIARDYLSTSK